MSKNSSKRILKILLATIIILGGFALYYFNKPLSEVVIPVDLEIPTTINQNGEQVELEWTDENHGEDLIIQSNKKTYFGIDESEIFFSITNANASDQELNVRLLFGDNEASLTNIVRLIGDDESNLTPTPEFSFKSKKKIPRDFTKSISYKDRIQTGQTNYYKATITYPVNTKGEFYVEAIGDEGAYGLLDPWYDSSGLVGCWTFDGDDVNWGTNTVTDCSGNGNDGTITNMSTTSSPIIGKVGQALNFDGVDDYINVGGIGVSRTSPISYGLWLKLDSYKNQIALNSGDSSGNRVINLGFNTTGLGDFLCGRSNQWVSSGYNTPLNEWTHIVCVDNYDIMKIYVNGSEVKSFDYDENLTLSSNTTEIVRIGEFVGGSGWYVDGKMDEVLIYNRALSPDEISQLYKKGTSRTKTKTSNVGRLTSGLVGHWTFDGADTNWGTNTVTDMSGNGNNGTMTNMSTTTSPAIGKVGQALDFDWVDDYVSVSSGELVAQNTISVCAWIKPDAVIHATDQFTIYVQNDKDSGRLTHQFRINSVSGKLSYDNYLPLGGSVEANTVLTVGTWYHTCVTRNNNDDVVIYLDGQSDGTGTGDARSSFADIDNTLIGARFYYGATKHKFDGSIDEVRVYNRALSASEITELYNMDSQKFQTNTSNKNRLTSGLVGYWTFDGADTDWGTNTVTDMSGNGNNGTMINMSTTTSPAIGKVGQALDFDGNGDYVITSDNASLDPGLLNFSLSGWIKTDKISGTFISKRDANNGYLGYIALTNSTGGFHFLLDDGTINEIAANTDNTFNDGSWHHVVFMRDNNDGVNGNIVIFVDGIRQGITYTDTSGGNINAYGSLSNSVDLFIGVDFKESDLSLSLEMDGTLDEVRVYNRALSSSEITELYNMGARRLKIR